MVYFIIEVIVVDFFGGKKGVDIDVEFFGIGGGFKLFCEGKIDIVDVFCFINKQEMKLCNDNQVWYVELFIVFDVIIVVSNFKNDWLKSLIVEELKCIWEFVVEKILICWN